MKISWTAGLLVFLLSLAGTSVAQSQTKGGHLCPLFSIFDYPPDALYYCDYFTYTTMCEWQDVGYYFGQFTTPVPWVTCTDDCTPAKVRPSKTYPGLGSKVPLDYMPTHPPAAPRPAPETPDSQSTLYINKLRSSHYIKFTYEGERFAKVIEYRLKRPGKVNCKKCEENKSESHWESKFVAFECETPGEEQEVSRVFHFDEVKPNPSPSVKRGDINYETGTGEMGPVLILLARPEARKEKK
ncbi:MAG: hypothetical protein K8T91_13315 [Planctomycetes bacterium]|nr:hypothetical protein [Planctomycetota bacterium]